MVARLTLNGRAFGAPRWGSSIVVLGGLRVADIQRCGQRGSLCLPPLRKGPRGGGFYGGTPEVKAGLPLSCC